MKTILSEKNLVVFLFVMVLITFSLAHEDTKKMENLYNSGNTSADITPAEKVQNPDLKDISTTTLVAIPSAQ